MVKSEAYYNELFEDLVKYGEFNPDDMLTDEDLREQLKKTLNNKYSEQLFNRIRQTSTFEQKTINNYKGKVEDLEKTQDYVLTPKQRRDIISQGLSDNDLVKYFKRQKKIPSPKLFNLKGISKGKPIMVRKEIIKVRRIKVIRYRDEKGRFAKYKG